MAKFTPPDRGVHADPVDGDLKKVRTWVGLFHDGDAYSLQLVSGSTSFLRGEEGKDRTVFRGKRPTYLPLVVGRSPGETLDLAVESGILTRPSKDPEGYIAGKLNTFYERNRDVFAKLAVDHNLFRCYAPTTHVVSHHTYPTSVAGFDDLVRALRTASPSSRLDATETKEPLASYPARPVKQHRYRVPGVNDEGPWVETFGGAKGSPRFMVVYRKGETSHTIHTTIGAAIHAAGLNADEAARALEAFYETDPSFRQDLANAHPEIQTGNISEVWLHLHGGHPTALMGEGRAFIRKEIADLLQQTIEWVDDSLDRQRECNYSPALVGGYRPRRPYVTFDRGMPLTLVRLPRNALIGPGERMYESPWEAAMVGVFSAKDLQTFFDTWPGALEELRSIHGTAALAGSDTYRYFGVDTRSGSPTKDTSTMTEKSSTQLPPLSLHSATVPTADWIPWLKLTKGQEGHWSGFLTVQKGTGEAASLDEAIRVHQLDPVEAARTVRDFYRRNWILAEKLHRGHEMHRCQNPRTLWRWIHGGYPSALLGDEMIVARSSLARSLGLSEDQVEDCLRDEAEGGEPYLPTRDPFLVPKPYVALPPGGGLTFVRLSDADIGGFDDCQKRFGSLWPSPFVATEQGKLSESDLRLFFEEWPRAMEELLVAHGPAATEHISLFPRASSPLSFAPPTTPETPMTTPTTSVSPTFKETALAAAETAKAYSKEVALRSGCRMFVRGLREGILTTMAKDKRAKGARAYVGAFLESELGEAGLGLVASYVLPELPPLKKYAWTARMATELRLEAGSKGLDVGLKMIEDLAGPTVRALIEFMGGVDEDEALPAAPVAELSASKGPPTSWEPLASAAETSTP